MRKPMLGLAMVAGVSVASCGLFGDEAATSTVFSDAKPLLVTNPANDCERIHVDLDNNYEYVFTFGRTDDGEEVSELGVDEDRVFAAIFDSPPNVQEGEITNFNESAVWIWHSAMKKADYLTTGTNFRNGKINFADGTFLKDGEPAGTDACTTTNTCGEIVSAIVNDRCIERLNGAKETKHYYFVAWAWNSDREISYYTDEPREFCFDATEAQLCEAPGEADGGTPDGGAPDGSTTNICARLCGL